MFIAYNFIACCLIASHIVAMNIIGHNMLNDIPVFALCITDYLFFTDTPPQ